MLLLVPGYWLGAWAWQEVLDHLPAASLRALPLTLPGLDQGDPGRLTRTLDDQAAAIVKAARDASGPVVVAAHSGANAPVSLVLDRHPGLVSRVVWIDSGPAAPGAAFGPEVPEDGDGLPLPPFAALGHQASLEGLDAEQLERFRDRAVSVPGPIVRRPVDLTNDARFEVPTTFVCCSMASAQVRELAAGGHPMFTEVSRLTSAEYVDLPTGHWPMWSRPAGLARVLASETSSA